MTYFADLSLYEYLGPPTAGVLNVGWLGEGHAFEVGETSSAFRTALKELCDTRSMAHCWGHHLCEFCPDVAWADPLSHVVGNGEIRVRHADGTWYVAPRLVLHYVTAHNYCPPPSFIEAVVSPAEIGRDPPASSAVSVRREGAPSSPMQSAHPPVTGAEIDKLVKDGILATRPRKRWWQF